MTGCCLPGAVLWASTGGRRLTDCIVTIGDTPIRPAEMIVPLEAAHDGVMRAGEFEMPALVDELLRQGRWPDSRGYAGGPAVVGSPVDAIMHGENEIWLFGPPFHTVDRDDLEWLGQFREPGHVDFAKAVIIGGFGPGSDAPIVLDFSSEPAQVKALQISGYPNPRAGSASWPDGASFCLEGHWVTLASSIEEFVETLGL